MPERMADEGHKSTKEQGGRLMKTVIWTLGGICAAMAGILVLRRRNQQPVTELAHKLEVAWADHHTVA